MTLLISLKITVRLIGDYKNGVWVEVEQSVRGQFLWGRRMTGVASAASGTAFGMGALPVGALSSM
jgi:hypothetical protein